MSPAVVELVLRPTIEKGGYHLDRFDAYLGEELIVRSRQPLLDGARALFNKGHSTETLLTARHHNRVGGWAPRPIGELMGWTIGESDRRGLRRHRWAPHPHSQTPAALCVGRTKDAR